MFRKIFCRVIIATAIVFSFSFMATSSIVFAEEDPTIAECTAQIKKNPMIPSLIFCADRLTLI